MMVIVPRIAAVSYLNTIPFIYGIGHEGNLRAELLLSPPAVCAKNFAEHKADIALVPAAAVPSLADAEIVTEYCIGAAGPVRTVVLLSGEPIETVRRVFLDAHSLTSVQLAGYLLAKHWKVSPEYYTMEDYAQLDHALPGDTFIVEPVSFIISNEGVLVSVRSAEFRTFRETEKRLQMNYRNDSTGYHHFISLLEVRIDFDADLVELIAKQVAALSKDINSEDSIDKAVLHRISALQESTMSLRENIFDRQRVLSGILRSERFPNDIYPRLQLMIKDVNSLINHADFSFQRLDYIQDAALGLINIEQNEIVKIFSVAAVIFMPATLIASIYGMNFKFMPELDWTLTLSNGWNIPLGYIFAIGLMIFCSALTIWYFKYKKWL